MAGEDASLGLSVVMPIAGSILVAAAGWVFTYFYGRWTASRQAKLEHINRQLGQLYGPLYARLIAGNEAWGAFTAKYWPQHGQDAYFAQGYDTSEEEKRRWRLWMKEVFFPNVAEIERIIVHNLDLVEGEGIPPAFLDFLSHIAVYRAVLKQWEQHNFSEHASIIDYPFDDLKRAVEPVYRALMAEKERLQ